MDGSSRQWTWTLVATLVFGLALASFFHGYVAGDPTRSVLLEENMAEEIGENEWATVAVADYQWVISLVSRHAHALLTRPHRLFQLEHCHPAEQALVFGEPMISFGLLGIPAYWLTGDPILTFNIVILELTLLAAFAMFFLVRSWTGSAAAAVVAALLFAFHEVRLRDLVHLYALDSTWLVLALFFATRLFREPRWRDALGLGSCCALQISGGVYPLVGALMVAPPLWIWLLIHHGPRRLSRWHWGAVALGVMLFAALVLGPYVHVVRAGVLTAREYQAHMPYSWLMPGGYFFPSWVILFLVPAALVLGRRRCTGQVGGDPRWALLIAGLLAMYVAAGGTTGQILKAISLGETPPLLLPNLYKTLASFIPGLAVIRAPVAIYTGAHVTLCILSGLGAAAILRSFPRKFAVYVAGALILAAYVDTVRPASLGLEPRVRYASLEIRPEPEILALFEELEARGNEGPVLEIPVNPPSIVFRGAALLAQAYHRRPTSQCYNSFPSPLKDVVNSLAADLPSDESVRALREMGFTTVVVHHKPYRTLETRTKLEAAGFARIAESANASAYALGPEPKERTGPPRLGGPVRPEGQTGRPGAGG